MFNFAALTPAIPAVDREYLYGSLDRKICDQYLEIFADFKYVRTFWDGAFAPLQFFPDVWTDVTHPFGITDTALASAYRFRTHSIHSPWRITRRLEDLIRGSRNLNQVLHLPGLSSPPSSDTVRWKPDRALPRSRRIITSLPAASKVIWVSLEIILRHGTGKLGSVITKIAGWSARRDRRHQCFASGIARYQSGNCLQSLRPQPELARGD